MTINQQLESLYSGKWNELKHALAEQPKETYTAPLLLKIDEQKFATSKKKVMYVGQETRGWREDLLNKETPVDLMDVYFNFMQKIFAGEKPYKNYKRSVFFQAIRYFGAEIGKHLGQEAPYIVWNNINKIGKGKGKTGVAKNIRKVERGHFAVFLKEVQITNPDLIIFFTGPDRDHDIRFHLRDCSFKQIDPQIPKRQLAQVITSDFDIPAVRLYHPNYFRGHHSVKDLALNWVLSKL